MPGTNFEESDAGSPVTFTTRRKPVGGLKAKVESLWQNSSIVLPSVLDYCPDLPPQSIFASLPLLSIVVVFS
jgi:hypothetical protein